MRKENEILRGMSATDKKRSVVIHGAKDINNGFATILFTPDGWRSPYGEFTFDEAKAMQWAKETNVLIACCLEVVEIENAA